MISLLIVNRILGKIIPKLVPLTDPGSEAISPGREW
jgi:hypothetical protein